MNKKNRIITAFLFVSLLIPAVGARGQSAGELVRVEYNNGWWPAAVLQVQQSFGANTHQIRYTQSGLTEWVAPNRIVSAAVASNPPPVGFSTDAAFLKAGRRVQVEYNGGWYPARLKEVKVSYGVNTYYIKYDQSGLMEWVAPNRIRSAAR